MAFEEENLRKILIDFMELQQIDEMILLCTNLLNKEKIGTTAIKETLDKINNIKMKSSIIYSKLMPLQFTLESYLREEERRLLIQQNRRLQKQCVMCGKPLGFFDKLFGNNEKHFGCKLFEE